MIHFHMVASILHLVVILKQMINDHIFGPKSVLFVIDSFHDVFVKRCGEEKKHRENQCSDDTCLGFEKLYRFCYPSGRVLVHDETQKPCNVEDR